jgi:Domain of unknown function (DUF4062)
MTAKKYQIFISSTFSDLQQERQLALKVILDLDHIPAGMEAFPAIDMEQFEYVKKIIDECDYYLLIMGARYGSTDNDGVSFTEREFDYAVSKGKTVIALLHSDIQSLPKKNFDADPALELKLNAFRDKVKNGRMVRFWNNHDKLIAGMMQAIVKAITTYPASGWIRGDAAANDETIQQYMQLRTAYDELSASYNTLLLDNTTKLGGLASLEEVFNVRYRYTVNTNSYSDSVQLAWKEIFRIVGPNLYSPSGAATIASNLERYIHQLNTKRSFVSVNELDADTVKIHLHAMGLLRIEASTSQGGGVLEYISLTERGKAELIRIMAVRTESSVR